MDFWHDEPQLGSLCTSDSKKTCLVFSIALKIDLANMYAVVTGNKAKRDQMY